MKLNQLISFRRPAMSKGMSATAFALVAVLGLGTLPACNDATAAETGNTTVLEERLEALETKENLRQFVLDFAHVVDTQDVATLQTLAPRLSPDFELRVIDFEGNEFKFVGYDGLVKDYGPIMLAAQANLAVSAIAVELEGDMATASFKFINSVKPPPQLGLPVNDKLLLLAANTAVFVKTNGEWQLQSLELIHSLAYPGEIPMMP